MKIKNITIENFRSVENISIDLLEDLNVFVGVNGSGKTTILEAISIALSWLVNRIQRLNSNGNSISESDIRYDFAYASIKITCQEEDEFYTWELFKGAKGKVIDKKSDLVEVSDLALCFQRKLEVNEILPIIAYYPVTRVVNKTSPEIKSKDNLYILDVYDNALGGSQNFHSFFEWFRLQDDIVNEKAVSRTKWLQQNRVLIKRQVTKILNLIQSSLSSEILGKEDFKHLSNRIGNDDFIYEEPRYFFRELINLIDFTYSKFKYKNDSVFGDLDYMFHKMEMLSRDYQDNLIASEGHYEELVFKIIRSINDIYKETDPEDNSIKVIWEIFVFANNLSLWWLSESGKRNLERLLRELFLNFTDKKQDLDTFLEQTHISFSQILKKEILQKKNAYRSEGKELQVVTQAIEKFIPEYTNLRVKRIPRPHMLINKGEEEFNLNQLSDGEKNLITLVGDIARRLAIANPNSPNPLQGYGVILIDEVDLHLHPSWQRRMVPQLTETFPNCQFIISTHSPQVLSHTKHESLFLLKNKNNSLSYSIATESYGKNSDRILEDLLEVDARPTNEKERIKKLFLLIENGSLVEAKKEIDELSSIIVGGDPELVKAKVLIKRKEIIGK